MDAKLKTFRQLLDHFSQWWSVFCLWTMLSVYMLSVCSMSCLWTLIFMYWLSTHWMSCLCAFMLLGILPFCWNALCQPTVFSMLNITVRISPSCHKKYFVMFQTGMVFRFNDFHIYYDQLGLVHHCYHE